MNTPNVSNLIHTANHTVYQPIDGVLNQQVLKDQNRQYRGTGGVSQENRSSGFSPVFQDTKTRIIYLSRFANGRVAPMHILDGLPDVLITKRTTSGHVSETLKSVVAGFVCDGCFYTREQAAKAVKPLNSFNT